jgi:hypothetical protein
MGDRLFEPFPAATRQIANLILGAHPISCFPASPGARASRTLSRTGVRPACGASGCGAGIHSGIRRRSAR